jgi:hypothetical protein
MLSLMTLAALLALPAAAVPEDSGEPDWRALEGKERRQAWKHAPIDPAYEPGFSAYTIGAKRVRLGLMNLDYGLLDNLQVGTAPVLDAVGVFNLHGKVTAIRTQRIDMSFEATGLFWNGSWGEDQESISVNAWPLMATGSWMISERFSLHLGYRWDNVDVRGSFDSEDLVRALMSSLGIDLSDEIYDALEDKGDLYGGGRLTLGQSRLAVDCRLNRRDSLILQVWRYNTLNARIDAGATVDETMEAGAAVHIQQPLDGVFAATTSIAYQMTLPRFRVRVGIPISGADAMPTMWLPQAFELSWLF